MSILTPVLQDEGNGLCQVLPALLKALPLTVRPGNLGTIPYVPLPVTLDDGGELVVEGAL